MAGYQIRDLVDEDVDEFLALFEDVFGGSRSKEWFDWKYNQNPYLDHQPIVVAEKGDSIVGARPLSGMEINFNKTRHLALPLAETMVHPDHRRQGIFTRMSRRTIEKYRDHRARLIYNFPSDMARPGYEKLGWRVAGVQPFNIRLNNVGTLARSKIDNRLMAIGQPVLNTGASAVMSARRRFSRLAPCGDVVVKDSGPVEELAELHARNRPATGHAVRDQEFYRWRFANPDRDYRTYLGYRGDELRSAVVTSTDKRGHFTVTVLTDVLPLRAEDADREVLANVLRKLILDCRESDLLRVPSRPVPDELLSRFSFIDDDAPIIEGRTRTMTKLVFSLEENWTIDGVRIDNISNWSTMGWDMDVY
jgi:GNAT superfamily N-acetyltransferase